MHELRIGELLRQQGVLTQSQLNDVLQEQQRTHRPFGVICEQRFNVEPAAVERAWSAQYARLTRRIDPEQETFDPQVRTMISRRQAWQFCVLPVRYDGTELMIATAEHQLLRALRFACNVLHVPAYMVLAEADALGRALAVHYPLAGMNEQTFGSLLNSLTTNGHRDTVGGSAL